MQGHVCAVYVRSRVMRCVSEVCVTQVERGQTYTRECVYMDEKIWLGS